MALTTVNVTGYISLPDGSATNAVVEFRLMQSDYDTVDDTIIPASTFKYTTTVAGYINTTLWPNDRGAHGSKYQVKVKWKDIKTKQSYEALMGFIQPTSSGSNDIADLLSAGSAGFNGVVYSIITEGEYQAALSAVSDAQAAQAAAEVAQGLSEDAQAAAENARDIAVAADTGMLFFDTVADFLAFDGSAVPVGTYAATRDGVGRYLRVANGTGHVPLGAPNWAVVGDGGVYHAGAWGVAAGADIGASLSAAISDVSAEGGGEIRMWAGQYYTSTAIAPQNNVRLSGVGGRPVISATVELTAAMYAEGDISNFHLVDIELDGGLNPNTGAFQHNLGAMTDCSFKRVLFKGSNSSWTVHVGYVEGSSGSPSDASTALATKSERVRFLDCEFGEHTNSTLEQLIIVNSRDVIVQGCEFDENETDANSVLVYAYSTDVSIVGNTFRNIQSAAVGVQESDDVRIERNVFRGEATMAGRFVSLINCADIWVRDNSCYATKTANPMFVGAYSWFGAYYESGNHTAQYQGVYRVRVEGNYVEGCYSVLQAPAQKQSDKNFIFEDFIVSGNTGSAFGGAPVIVGNYTVTDAVNQVESIARWAVSGNIWSDWDGFDEGWLYAVGTPTSNISNITVQRNISPPASGGTNGYGMSLSYVDQFSIIGNTVQGKGSRQAIKTSHEGVGVIHSNDTVGTGIDFTYSAAVDARGNLGATIPQERHLQRVLADHGVQIDAGSVVVLKNESDQTDVSMTTTAGDYRSVGFMLSDTPHGSWGWCVVRGRHPSIRVNASTAVSIGDRIGASSVEGIGIVSTSGQTWLAIAGDAASGSADTTVPALIVPPRTI